MTEKDRMMFQCVAEFTDKMGIPIPGIPNGGMNMGLPEDSITRRQVLLTEEYQEYCNSKFPHDAVDALCDISYVAMGGIVECTGGNEDIYDSITLGWNLDTDSADLGKYIESYKHIAADSRVRTIIMCHRIIICCFALAREQLNIDADTLYKCFIIVHWANMDKIGGKSDRNDIDAHKPEGWQPPDFGDLIYSD